MTQLRLVGVDVDEETGEITGIEDPVRQVFEFWATVMEKPHSKMGDKRRDRIKAALKMGYSVDELRLAIAGCKYDAWSQGDNDRHRAYNDIELICRDETKIDRFIELGNEYMDKTAKRDAKVAAQAMQVAQDAERVAMPPAIRERLDAMLKRHRRT